MDTGARGSLSDWASRRVLHPELYTWFVFLSVMDVLLTAIALQFGAREANMLGAWMLQQFGVGGLVVLKFTAVPLVILMCEYVGRRKPPTGRRLTEWVVALAAIPVIITPIMLIMRIAGIA